MDWPVAAALLFVFKMAAYTFAGKYLLRMYNAEGSAVVFGIVRAIMGLALGGALLFLTRPPGAPPYALLVLVHFLAWSGCLALFFGPDGEDWSRVVLGALLGTVFSMVLDLPSLVIVMPLLVRSC